MDRKILAVDTSSEFGKYRLGCRQNIARKIAAKVSAKPIINLVRAVGGLRSCKIADVEVYGGKMRVYPGLNRSDKIMLGMPHVFDVAERNALANHLQKSKNTSFLDIGANIGAYSLFVSTLGLDAKIIAVEADPEMFARLSFNVPENVTKLNLAVADEQGVLPFYINENNRGENSLVASRGKKIEVLAKTLLQILDENSVQKPTALKIDVEGWEFKIFQKFLADALEERWPEMVIMEHIHCTEALELLLTKGYKEQLKTKMNVVLAL